MRKFKMIMLGVWLVATAAVMQSCLDDDDDDNYVNNNLYPSAVVTVHPDDGNTSFYMQLDDSTRLNPTNMTKSPYGKKVVRALVNYTLDSGAAAQNIYMTTKNVKVNWIDSIRTKEMVPDLGADNDKTYGNDQVEIVNDWLTVVEDGFITLRIRTKFSPSGKHAFDLVAGTDPANPYKVVLHHNANGDIYGGAADVLVAFRLSGTLPPTDGKVEKLTLEWNSYSGKKSTTFKYRTPNPLE